MLFRGNLSSICRVEGMDRYLYKDFSAFVQRISKRVKECAEQMVQRQRAATFGKLQKLIGIDVRRGRLKLRTLIDKLYLQDLQLVRESHLSLPLESCCTGLAASGIRSREFLIDVDYVQKDARQMIEVMIDCNQRRIQD
jgi:hypothetical protein